MCVGAFDHQATENAQFYGAKYDALAHWVRASDTGLRNSQILDTAGGSGEFVPYFVPRSCCCASAAGYSAVALERVYRRWLKHARVEAPVDDLACCSPDLMRVPYSFVFVQEAISLIPEDEP